jgi:hypothetical protein
MTRLRRLFTAPSTFCCASSQKIGPKHREIIGPTGRKQSRLAVSSLAANREEWSAANAKGCGAFKVFCPTSGVDGIVHVRLLRPVIGRTTIMQLPLGGLVWGLMAPCGRTRKIHSSGYLSCVFSRSISLANDSAPVRHFSFPSRRNQARSRPFDLHGGGQAQNVRNTKQPMIVKGERESAAKCAAVPTSGSSYLYGNNTDENHKKPLP